MSHASAASSTLAVALALWCASSGPARAAVVYSYPTTPAPVAHGSRRTTKPPRALPASSSSLAFAHTQSGARAPSGPPLTSAISSPASEDTTGVPSAKGDQLVENGLSSPLCKGSMSGGLSNAAQVNCQTSGFVGAPAPTNNYDLDVNIDVGPLGLSRGGLLSVIQDVFIAPVWETLVWAVHALVVMLQWCYTLELLGGSTMGGIASSLREAQTSFTEPWLALVLAVGSMLALYNGLVRRRVAETLGQTLLTIAMTAAGLWVIADPFGTVGAVGQWANQASLGTLGAVAQGRTANAPRTLGDGMRALFAGAIEMPWCYLEFGDVRWCSDVGSLDPRLRRAASSIVASQQAKLGCRPSLAHPLCRKDLSTLTVEHTGELVRAADTNGALFLAFPANGPERNSVKNQNSLLHVLCQSEDDTKCEGSTAAQAEFRSGSGTFPRMIGVVLIAIGVLGMAMLFGLLAVHLLAAAVLSLFLLLLAPIAALAPALGDRGRALFAGWVTRLLGAVSSKLIFSFLLGALLTMQRLLTSLQALGWWTQWLLISSFWWSLFLKRHQAMALLTNRSSGPAAQRRQSIARRLGAAAETPRALLNTARWAKRKILSPAPDSEQLRKRARTTTPATRQTARKGGDEQATRPLEHDGGEARTCRQAGPRIHERLSAKREQLERLHRARKTALASGDRRRAAKLAVRGQRVEAELAREQEALDSARPSVAESESTRRAGGSRHTRKQRVKRERLIGAQAALPASLQRQPEAAQRDYRALSSLAGYGREEYAQLGSRERREARLQIDRELTRRTQLGAAAGDVTDANAPDLGRREQRGVDRELDRALAQRTRTNGVSSPRALEGSTPEAPSRDLAAARAEAPDNTRDARMGANAPRSSVMDDAREVAAGRKRQLGFEPPPIDEPAR